MFHSVIKPVVKNKSPPGSAVELHDTPNEKLPVERVKPSSTKSKTHSKEKSSAVLPSISLKCTKEDDVESIPETKQSKSKKSIVSPAVPPSSDVNVDIPSTASGNTSISSSVDTNSASSSNKHKIKTVKKSKKTEIEKPAAFYFVST